MPYLAERLTFDQLFRYSDSRRVKRSSLVRGPPLEIDANSDAIYHTFNFKSFPSTTGLRHRGYIKFVKPPNKNPNGIPLQHVPCVTDCDCEDYRYRWAWSNKQRGSSVVGPQSLNKALNRAPRITNPAGRIGLCKHTLACRDYIYGLLSKFPDGEPDTAEKLNKLIQMSNRRWSDHDALVTAAKSRDAWYSKAREARRLGLPPPPNPPPNVAPSYKAAKLPALPPGTPDVPPALPAKLPVTVTKGPVLPQAGKPNLPPQSFASGIKPPGARGRTLSAIPEPPQLGSDKYAQQAKKAGVPTAAELKAKRTIGDSLKLNRALTLVEQLMQTI